MEHRTLGKSGVRVSALGLGTEHILKEEGTLDRIVGMAVDAGVSYVDLLYTSAEYWEEHGTLFAHHRGELALAPHWNAHDGHDNEVNQASFENILAHLGNDYAEVGLVTMIENQRDWKGWGREAIERLQRFKDAGRIGAIAVSGHYPRMLRIVAESDQVDAIMFGINLLGKDAQDERALREACVAHDVSLIAMKPYHGGTLLTANGKPTGITPSQCLSYVLSLPAVATTVPGPKTADEWAETLRFLEATEADKDNSRAVASLKEILAGQCVYCQHCLPCPEELEIGWIIWLVDAARDGVTDELHKMYDDYEVKASACVQCGACLERCPYDVDIMAKLEQAAAIFGI